MQSLFFCSLLVYQITALLLLSIWPRVANAGEFLVPPEDQRIAINTGAAKFSCQTRGSDAQWRIDGWYYNAENGTVDEIVFVEYITYHEYDYTQNIFDMNLWVPSSIERNMTEVVCVSTINQRQHSDAVHLIIMGGPAAPEPTLSVINSSHLTLNWNSPFTWEEHPIQHYVVSSDNSLFFEPKLTLGTPTTSTLIQRVDGTGECEVIQFSVRANNGLADSLKGSVSGGFPIAPDMSGVSIQESVLFTQDLSPRVSLSMQLPRVCSFQDIEYRVVLTQINADTESEVGVSPTKRLQYGGGHTVTVEFTEGLTNGASYRATALFWTFAEDDESISTPVGASKTFSIIVRNGPNEPLNTPPPSFTQEYIIAIAVGGGGVIIVLIVLIIVALVVCCSVRRKSRFSTEAHQTNIVLEGNTEVPFQVKSSPQNESRIYESIDCFQKNPAYSTPHSFVPPRIEQNTPDQLIVPRTELDSKYNDSLLLSCSEAGRTDAGVQLVESEEYTLMSPVSVQTTGNTAHVNKLAI